MCVGVEGLCVLVSKVVCVEGLCECWKLVGVFGFGRLIGCVGAKEQKQYRFGALPVVQHNSNLFRGLQIIEYNRRQFVFQNKCLVIRSYFRI